ncbi:hypothetical protein GBF38_005348 [Nibea albiflora]|uniref:Uncharacterized protein n=1 Tax=Nibea albiflora TaxID=240163 RepID=A0ACB7EVA7_NIBAL|nr:hypothetical protein GBF38_005348 [Nibea albiflora]
MYSELECGICYRTYNAGRRCPRELQCKHSFCESCLLALSRPLAPEEARQGADRSITCPLCRQTTSITGERPMRAELRVDECVLERLLSAGVLDRRGGRRGRPRGSGRGRSSSRRLLRRQPGGGGGGGGAHGDPSRGERLDRRVQGREGSGGLGGKFGGR